MSPSSAKTYRVLFVEDAFDHALVVKSFLAGADRNYSVSYSQDGDNAVQLLKDEEWDLVITDLNLPGTDGFEVIRRGRAKSADLPILATTGYTGPEYQEQALRAGANNVLIKPLEKDDFLNVVASLIAPAPKVRSSEANILAVSALPGDAEMGCGGTLARAAAKGRSVFVVPLFQDDEDPQGIALDASRKACRLLGLRAVVDRRALTNTQRRMALMEKAISDVAPAELYVPAMGDRHPARMEAFRVAQAVSGPVETVLGYQTATTGTRFKPTHFVDVSDRMARKKKALSTFGAEGSVRPDLEADIAEAYARHWGRLHDYTDAEAFEVVKGKA